MTGILGMVEKEHSVGAVLGRFQFFHKGHERLIVEAAAKCDILLILIGSSQEFGTAKNPMSLMQRSHTICECLVSNGIDDVLLIPVADVLYDDQAWLDNVLDSIAVWDIELPEQTPLYCFDRGGDHQERQMMEPYFKTHCLGDDHCGTSSTEVRHKYYYPLLSADWRLGLPKYSWEYIETLDLSPAKEEAYEQHKEDWKWNPAKEFAPFPLPNFDCVDMIVRDHLGDILTIVRGEYPGKGKLAMPGGAVDLGETFLQAAVRELKEETGLTAKVEDVKFLDLFSAGLRGGNRNTFVYYVDFESCEGILSPQEGEVQSLQWSKVPEIGEHGWFSDHAHIINKVLKEI